MAEIVNLTRTRKARQRDAADQRAAENRVRHGRTKAQKQNDACEAERRTALLDGLRTGEAAPNKVEK